MCAELTITICTGVSSPAFGTDAAEAVQVFDTGGAIRTWRRQACMLHWWEGRHKKQNRIMVHIQFLFIWMEKLIAVLTLENLKILRETFLSEKETLKPHPTEIGHYLRWGDEAERSLPTKINLFKPVFVPRIWKLWNQGFAGGKNPKYRIQLNNP